MAQDIATSTTPLPNILGSSPLPILAVVNQKGGVGKTTTAINLSAAVAELGHPVLLIDLDPQANSTSGLGLNPARARLTIYHVLAGECTLSEAAVPSGAPGLQLVRSQLNPQLEVGGILMTQFDARTTLAWDVLAEVRRSHPNELLKTLIPRNVRLSEAPSHGKPVTQYDPTCRGAAAYRELAHELMSRSRP